MQAIVAPESQIETIKHEILSFEEYLRQYSSREGLKSEWLGGEVAIYPVTNNLAHQRLLYVLSFLLHYFLSQKQLGQLVFMGLPMKYSDQHPAREPDLMVLLNEHANRLRPTSVEGIADVVIEIVLPESTARDRGDKFIEYENAGVPEYWLLDPIRNEALIYALDAQGTYERVPLDEQDRIVSRVLPGFAVSQAFMWRAILPDAVELIAEAQKLG
jgi:Uma2 family endonuclease